MKLYISCYFVTLREETYDDGDFLSFQKTSLINKKNSKIKETIHNNHHVLHDPFIHKKKTRIKKIIKVNEYMESISK